MKDEEILKRVIEKAEQSGYKFWNVASKHIELLEDEGYWRYKKGKNFYASVNQVIFSHDFAKAFWKKDIVDHSFSVEYGYDNVSLGRNYLPEWEMHLSKMVLKENPIKYLEQFLFP